MNWLLIPGILGPLMGPAVGGLIVTYGSWHWIFLINVPVAILGIVTTLAVVPDLRDSERRPFDVVGNLLVAAASFSLAFGLESAARPKVGWVTPALLGLGGALALAYVGYARRARAPVLDLSLLSVGSFRNSMISGSVLRIIFGATGFLLPLWFQLAMGMSPAQTGMLLVMTAVGALVSRFLGARLVRSHHPRAVMLWSIAYQAAMLLLVSTLRPSLPTPLFYLVIGLQGLGSALSLMVISAVAYVDIPPGRAAAATGFYTAVQQLTFTIGVTAAVWTISLMRWLFHATPSDNATYVGSLAILSLCALGALQAARKLDPASLGTLGAKKAAA
jgi:MFS family permease